MAKPGELSENETKMVMAIDPTGHWVKLMEEGRIMVPMCLELLGGRMFVENRIGPEVAALRRCLKHLGAGKYRANPEYEQLIAFEGA